MPATAFRSAVDLVGAIRRRELGSRELLEQLLARVERLNPRINAVIALDVERARRGADAADRAVARGEPLGALHGLPMTIKDVMETAGLRTTSGAEIYRDHVPAADATAVARLVAAGAVVFGKTNTPTFAMDCQTYNGLFGPTNNPWDTSRAVGGSSGGSAAALAAGLTALELGTDIGGSIRNPAHYCGVYGHKPSFGIVPMRGYIPPPPGTLGDTDINVIGPLARSAEDLALALDVLAGPDDARAVAWRLTLPAARRSQLRDHRVAAWLDDPACPTDAAVGARLQAAVDAVGAAGARVDDRARPGFDLGAAYRDYYELLCLAASAALGEEQFTSLAGFGDGVAADADDITARYARASTRRHRHWLALNEARERYRRLWADFFRAYDVLLCPVTPVAAIPHDHDPNWATRTIQVNGGPRPYEDQIVWPGIVGLAYLPATVAPVGRTPGGLPVGIQIVGPYLEDRTPIEFARRLGEVCGGFEVPPGFEE